MRNVINPPLPLEWINWAFLYEERDKSRPYEVTNAVNKKDKRNKRIPPLNFYWAFLFFKKTIAPLHF